MWEARMYNYVEMVYIYARGVFRNIFFFWLLKDQVRLNNIIKHWIILHYRVGEDRGRGRRENEWQEWSRLSYQIRSNHTWMQRTTSRQSYRHTQRESRSSFTLDLLARVHQFFIPHFCFIENKWAQHKTSEQSLLYIQAKHDPSEPWSCSRYL